MHLPGSGSGSGSGDLLLTALSPQGAAPSLRGQGLLVVEDTLQVSASFVVHTLLHQALREGDQVVLLALEQSLEKYKYCQKKMGITLQQYMDSGQLCVLAAQDLDLAGPCLIKDPVGTLKKLYRLILQELVAGSTAATGSTHAGSTVGAGQRETAACGAAPTAHTSTPGSTQQQQQQQQQQGGISRQSHTSWGGVTVLLDNVSLLSSLGCSSEDWRLFLHRCSALGRHIQQPCTCIMVAHGDIPDDAHWLLYLKHMAEVVVSIAPLGMRMADIDGTVTITRRSALQPVGSTHQHGGGSGTARLVQIDSGFEAVRSLYFRAGEMGVRWIPHLAVSDLM